MSAANKPHGFGEWASECPPCDQACQQGRWCPAQEACAQSMGMWDDERESPWLLLVYAVAVVAMIAASALFPIWF